MPVSSPPAKRIKLEIDSDDEAEIFKPALPPKQPTNLTKADEHSDEDEELGEHCSICLQPISDRTVIPACSHEFCFECLLIWTGPCQSFLVFIRVPSMMILYHLPPSHTYDCLEL